MSRDPRDSGVESLRYCADVLRSRGCCETRTHIQHAPMLFIHNWVHLSGLVAISNCMSSAKWPLTSGDLNTNLAIGSAFCLMFLVVQSCLCLMLIKTFIICYQTMYLVFTFSLSRWSLDETNDLSPVDSYLTTVCHCMQVYTWLNSFSIPHFITENCVNQCENWAWMNKCMCDGCMQTYICLCVCTRMH